MNKYVCITIGDIKGIGYEILLSCFKQLGFKYVVSITDCKMQLRYKLLKSLAKLRHSNYNVAVLIVH